MNCREFSKYIGDYVNRTLRDELAVSAEMHINECSECASLVSELENTSAMVRSLEYKRAPIGFEERLKSRIAAQNTSPAESNERSWLRNIGRAIFGVPAQGHRLALRSALAGVLLCAVIGASMLITPHQNPVSKPDVDWSYINTCRKEHVSFTATNPLADDSAAMLRERSENSAMDL